MIIPEISCKRTAALARLEEMLCPRCANWDIILPKHVALHRVEAMANWNREASESYMLPDTIEREYINKYADHMIDTIRVSQRKSLDAICIEANKYIVAGVISECDVQDLLTELVGHRNALLRNGVHMLDLMTGDKIDFILARVGQNPCWHRPR